jgi:Protein of unknown function (DUF3592)
MHNLPTHLAAPPRRVPVSLQIVNFFNGASQIGWFVFGFGFIFFVVFGLQSDFSFVTFRNARGRTTGRVIETKSTGASENEQTVQATHYEYSIAGSTLRGTSYTTGSAPEQGAEVTVEYDESNPLRSRVEGMRRGMFGPWAVISGIFPLIGVVILYFAAKYGVRRNRLLRNGLLTTGRLTDKEPTNMTVNKRRVWKLTFEFFDRRGQRREAFAQTTDTQRLEDESAEPLLYDPEDPARAYLLDEAPARPQFHMTGELIGRPNAALAALIIPTIVIGGYTLLFAIRSGVFR